MQTAALKLSTSVRVATVAAPSGPPGGSGSTSLDAQIKAAERELLALQKQLDAALAGARADLAAAKAACSSPPPPTSTTSTTVPSSPGTCTDAQQASLDAQAQVATLEAQVGTAISKLDASALEGRRDEHRLGPHPHLLPFRHDGNRVEQQLPVHQGLGQQHPERIDRRHEHRLLGGSTSTTPTAAQLASYQSAVDAAASKVAVAEQSLAAASIVSPINGTVTSVTLAKGDSVSASSTTANVVVVGKGGYEVSVPVSVTDRPSVAVGQAATVVPDSNGKPLRGTVVALSVAGTTSGSTTTYTAVIGLTDSRATGLHDGAGAGTSITVATVANALTVPTSAVHTTNSTHTVTVLEGGKTRSVTVKLGTVGADRTVITKGLTAGRKVVLADLSQPLPSSASQANTRTGRFGAGGFGGTSPGARCRLRGLRRQPHRQLTPTRPRTTVACPWMVAQQPSTDTQWVRRW